MSVIELLSVIAIAGGIIYVGKKYLRKKQYNLSNPVQFNPIRNDQISENDMKLIQAVQNKVSEVENVNATLDDLKAKIDTIDEQIEQLKHVRSEYLNGYYNSKTNEESKMENDEIEHLDEMDKLLKELEEKSAEYHEQLKPLYGELKKKNNALDAAQYGLKQAHYQGGYRRSRKRGGRRTRSRKRTRAYSKRGRKK